MGNYLKIIDAKSGNESIIPKDVFNELKLNPSFKYIDGGKEKDRFSIVEEVNDSGRNDAEEANHLLSLQSDQNAKQQIINEIKNGVQ